MQKMSRRNQIDIVYSAILKLEYCLIELAVGVFAPESSRAAYLLVLTEYTAKRASREEYSTRTARAAYDGFFKMVGGYASHTKRVAFTAKASFVFLTVDTAFARTDITDRHRYSPFPFFYILSKKQPFCGIFLKFYKKLTIMLARRAIFVVE
jgi:hypothetical protein